MVACPTSKRAPSWWNPPVRNNQSPIASLKSMDRTIFKKFSTMLKGKHYIAHIHMAWPQLLLNISRLMLKYFEGLVSTLNSKSGWPQIYLPMNTKNTMNNVITNWVVVVVKTGGSGGKKKAWWWYHLTVNSIGTVGCDIPVMWPLG